MGKKAQIFGKDGNLSALMKQHGIQTVAELARQCDMPLPSINNAVNGHSDAIFAEEPGAYRQPARRIAEVLGVIPEVLFGEDPRAEERRQDVEEVFLASHPTASPQTPDQKLEQEQLRDNITRVLGSLTPRDDQVLRMRFGIDMNTSTTLGESDQFSVTRERIRQIEAKAIRKLKDPNRGRRIRSFLDG